VHLTLAAHTVLPSDPQDVVGTPDVLFFAAQYPARTFPCQRFAFASRQPAHDSGPKWVATPSSYGSFIRYSLPVFIGAFPEPEPQPVPKVRVFLSSNDPA